MQGTIGAHTVTVTASLTNYPSVTLEKTFILTIVDPCSITTLVWTGSINSLTFALGDADSSNNPIPLIEQAPITIEDQVSIDRPGTSLCGAISYDVSSVAALGVTDLTASELTISSSG